MWYLTSLYCNNAIQQRKVSSKIENLQSGKMQKKNCQAHDCQLFLQKTSHVNYD